MPPTPPTTARCCGAIKSIDANISTASGGLGVELPYRMLEFFELTASGQVFYRVATEDGLVEIGNADLPPPRAPLVTGQPQFSDATLLRRAGARRLLCAAARPAAGRRSRRRSASSSRSPRRCSRARPSRARWCWQSVARDLRAGAGGHRRCWCWRSAGRCGRWRGCAPRCRRARRRTCAPISAGGIPADVRPLVEAINHHVERNRRAGRSAAALRRRRLAPAAHAADHAGHAGRLRAARARSRGAAPGAARRSRRSSTRPCARPTRCWRWRAPTAPSSRPSRSTCAALAQAVTRAVVDRGARRRHRPGLRAAPARRCAVSAQPALLKEALSNLLHNAIRYTPRGGQVTVQVSRAAAARRDRGRRRRARAFRPTNCARAGERFFRGSNVDAAGHRAGAGDRAVDRRAAGRQPAAGAGPRRAAG